MLGWNILFWKSREGSKQQGNRKRDGSIWRPRPACKTPKFVPSFKNTNTGYFLFLKKSENRASCFMRCWLVTWKEVKPIENTKNRIREWIFSLHFCDAALHQRNIAFRLQNLHLASFTNIFSQRKALFANSTVNMGRYCSPAHWADAAQKYSKISKGFPGLQNIPKYSGTFQDIPEIVHLSRMVLPGLKYFSETGWPWSSTAVNSGTENIDLVFANV